MKQTQHPGFSEKSENTINPLTILRTAIFIVLPAVILFGSAGTIQWPMGWIYLGLTVGGALLSRVLAGRVHPDLLRERASSLYAEDVPQWDRILVAFVATFIPATIMLVAGTDKRFGWSPVHTVWPAVAGTLLLIAAMALVIWAMTTNRFFSAYVRIQTERGQQPVSSGPYAVIRHPGYLGGILNNVAAPLILGSWWTFIPAVIGIGFIILRSALEDRWLQVSLTGYSDYARKVKWRLIPFIW